MRVNFIAFAYVYFSYQLHLHSLRGNKIVLSSFRSNSVLSELMPLRAEILNQIEIRNENDWLLVKLFDTGKYGAIRLKDKNERYKPHKKNQLVYLCMLNDQTPIEFETIPDSSLGIGDWAFSSPLR